MLGVGILPVRLLPTRRASLLGLEYLNILCKTTKHQELFQGQTPGEQRLKEMLKVVYLI